MNRSRPIMNLFDKKPALGSDVFVAPSAAVIGDVKLGSKSSVFYGSVLRGEEEGLEGLVAGLLWAGRCIARPCSKLTRPLHALQVTAGLSRWESGQTFRMGL